MKKILIAHIPNTLNYGSAMMAVNLIAGLRERLGHQIDIYCDCDDYHLERLKTATGDQSLKSFLVPKLDPTKSFFWKGWELFSGKGILVREVSSRFEMMIVLGGDDLSETYMKGAILLGLQYTHINQKCRVVLAGQSIGPFTGIYRLLAQLLFRKVTVITRDDNSYDFCVKTLNLLDVHKSQDLAIHPLPFQEKWNNVLRNFKLEESRYIAVVPSGLVSAYTGDRTGYIETWKHLIRRIIRREVNGKVVVLAHVLSPETSSDVPVIEELMNGLSDDEKVHILVCKSPMQPAEARAVLGGARFVITGRMHAAISAFYCRKPAISLAYSEKYFGVIGRGLGLDEMIIDCRSMRWGKESHILIDVDKALDNIVKNYDKLSKKIQIGIEKSIIVVDQQLDLIEKLIRQ